MKSLIGVRVSHPNAHDIMHELALPHHNPQEVKSELVEVDMGPGAGKVLTGTASAIFPDENIDLTRRVLDKHGISYCVVKRGWLGWYNA